MNINFLQGFRDAVEIVWQLSSFVLVILNKTSVCLFDFCFVFLKNPVIPPTIILKKMLAQLEDFDIGMQIGKGSLCKVRVFRDHQNLLIQMISFIEDMDSHLTEFTIIYSFWNGMSLIPLNGIMPSLLN